ncbi:MAG: ATP phosphoribosyltransferase [Dehalococcoidia bacterium]|nr:ATP phosphoribosyltransferase [Dehalococcoidia bacterium]
MLTGRQPDCVKLALPKGRLLPATACLLTETGLEFDGYTQDTRTYRLRSINFPHVSAKMFQERDIPIQVAVGNYDLGICSSDWLEELLARYPASALVSVLDLEYNKGNLYMAASQHGDTSSLRELPAKQDSWRIVTEYPNLAEALALSLRLRRFRVFPVWGAAEVYPPENADLILLWGRDESEIRSQSLVPLTTFRSTSAFLIANQESWQAKNVGQVIAQFSRGLGMRVKPWLQLKRKPAESVGRFYPDFSEEKVRLAVPDGHQQAPASEFLSRAGLELQDYSGGTPNRRPSLNLDWVNVKVIRPQDMPLQVANGSFDLAITGKDWLLDHLYRFPSSPVTELVELGFGEVKVVAVVSRDSPAATINDLKELLQAERASPLRVASEYVNIADKYLRDNHASRYKLIPTWGATEAFLPEDADLLIENTQTGKTLAKHNLKILDTLFQSTACLVGNKSSLESSAKRKKIASLVKIIHQTAEANHHEHH